MAAAVRWPTAVDYQTALQIPAVCFKDPALKRGLVITDPLGLPLAASGNVVVAFRLKLDRGDVAVRCFTRQSSFSAVQLRYEALHAHRSLFHLPACVESRYRPDEVLVGGHRYAVVLMDWVRGAHLHRYVAEHIGDAATLHALADQWRVLMARLRTARFAHGDLSDGNVLVDWKGRLRLIDYDAAYVPALHGRPPDELGKPNYQHPERLRAGSPFYGYYAEDMDAFSALVIYLSLRALADDPSRWTRYHTGENLVFVQQDYEHPGEASIWQDLWRSRDVEVNALAEVLAHFCRGSAAGLSDLEEVLQDVTARPLRSHPREAPPDQTAPPAQPASPAPERLPDRPPAGEAPTEPPGPRVAWRRRSLAGLAAALLLAAAVAALSRSGGCGQEAQETPARAAEVPAMLAPEDLVGFYTGYATLQNGTREALALTLAPPDTVYAGDAGPEARLFYAINWKSHQSGGAGRYHMHTGRLDLDNHYALYVASANAHEIVLASLPQQPHGPIIKVNKRRSS